MAVLLAGKELPVAMDYGFGWIPDVPQVGDYHPSHDEVRPLLAKTPLAPFFADEGKSGALPSKFSLRSRFPPIQYQLSLNSCTANCAATLLEYFERQAGGPFIAASRLFIYKATRNLMKATGDAGATNRATMKALSLFGAPPEDYWPYRVDSFDLEPSPFLYALGQRFAASKYYRLDRVDTSPDDTLKMLRILLAHGVPSMFGFPVYPEYRVPLPGGLVKYPAPESQAQLGHANVAVGYDDDLQIGADRGAIEVRNSWGPEWGDGGYGWMSYRYLKEGLAKDWWSILKVRWVDRNSFAKEPSAADPPLG